MLRRRELWWRNDLPTFAMGGALQGRGIGWRARGNEGLLGRALMLYTHSFFLYSFSAQSQCIVALLFFTNICLCQMCVCIGTKVKNVALLFLRVPAKTCGGVKMERKPSKIVT